MRIGKYSLYGARWGSMRYLLSALSKPSRGNLKKVTVIPPTNPLAWLSPSIRKFDDEFIYSGLSTSVREYFDVFFRV
jgi:hypothetical protein